MFFWFFKNFVFISNRAVNTSATLTLQPCNVSFYITHFMNYLKILRLFFIETHLKAHFNFINFNKQDYTSLNFLNFLKEIK